MTYEQNERAAYEWFTTNYDKEATLVGGMDSTQSDIYSPKFGCYVEVKMITKALSARCGQFVESTMDNNPFSSRLLSDESDENLKGFVRYHYSQKDVGYFIVGDGDYTLLTMEDFLSLAQFTFAKPYLKRSGTNKCSKKMADMLLSNFSELVRKDDGDVYCEDESRFGEVFAFDGREFVISSKNKGQVRVRGKAPQNVTYHIEVKMK